jgi:hypothetical protein
MGFGGEAGRDESGRECAHGAGYSSGAAKCESRLEGNNSFRAERGGATPPACAGSQRPKWVYLGPDFLYRAHCPVYRKTAFLAVSRTARRRQPMPVIGFLMPASVASWLHLLTFRRRRPKPRPLHIG